MNPRFLALFEALQTEYPELDSMMLADALWLHQRRYQTPEQQPKQTTHLPSTPTPPTQIFAPNHPTEPPHKPQIQRPKQPTRSVTDERFGLVAGSENWETNVRVPEANAIPNRHSLLKAMRPLRARVDSSHLFALDEQATAHRIAEEKLFLPILKPLKEKWLDVVLIVEFAKHMGPWGKLVEETQEMFEQLGAFRSVQVWNLYASAKTNTQKNATKQPIHVRPGGLLNPRWDREASPNILNDATKKRLYFIISDCTSGMWSDGRIADVMQSWMAYGSVAVLQVLPESMWSQTSLLRAPSIRLRPAPLQHPGNKWKKEPLHPIPHSQDAESYLQQFAIVPVVHLETKCLASFAKLLVGMRGGSALGCAFMLSKVYNSPEVKKNREQMERFRRERDSRRPPQTTGRDAEKTLFAFWSIASPGAKKLAQMLASAPAATIPIIKLIRQTMLPKSSQVHEAEVLLGGILQVANGHKNPEQILYDFKPGIRNLLLDGTSLSLSLQILKRVSSYIETHFGKLKGFTTSLQKPPGDFTDLDVPASHHTEQPFAYIARQILERQGSHYTKALQKAGSSSKLGIPQTLIDGRLEGEDLKGQDLRDIDLRRARLRGADLSGANLSRADLRGTQFQDAILKETIFTHARFNSRTKWPKDFDPTSIQAFGPGAAFSHEPDRLKGYNLREYSLQDASFDTCNLSKATLDYAYLVRSTLHNSDFSSATFINAQLDRADCSLSDFTFADLSYAVLEEATCFEADFAYASLIETQANSLDGVRTSFIGADFTGANLQNALFQDAVLQQACFRSCALQDANFSGADLSGCIFDGAIIEDAIIDREAIRTSKWNAEQVLWWFEQGGILADQHTSPNPLSHIPSPPWPSSQIEHAIAADLRRKGAFVTIVAPPGFGKSIYLQRTLELLQHQNYLHFTIEYPGNFATVEPLDVLDAILKYICFGLGNVSPNPNAIGALDALEAVDGEFIHHCTNYIEKIILPHLNAPIVLALPMFEMYHDLLSDSFNAFIGLLLTWNHYASEDHSLSNWGKLRFLCTTTGIHSTQTAALESFIVNEQLPSDSIHNIPNWTIEELEELAQQLDVKLTAKECGQLHYWLGGIPELSAQAIAHLDKTRSDVESLLQNLSDGQYEPFSSSLGILYEEAIHKHKLDKSLLRLLISSTVEPIEHKDKLRRLGLIRTDLHTNRTMISCELYRRYFLDALRISTN